MFQRRWLFNCTLFFQQQKTHYSIYICVHQYQIGEHDGTNSSIETWTNSDRVWCERGSRTEAGRGITYQRQRKIETGSKGWSKCVSIFKSYFQLLRWYKAKCLQQQPHLRRASAWWRKKRARTLAFGASKLLNHLFLHQKGADFVFVLISFFYPKVKHPWKQHVSVEAQ